MRSFDCPGKYGRQAAARNLAAKSDNKARFAQQQDAVAEYAGSHQSRSLESEAEAGINARSASAQAESAKNARGAAKGTADLTAALRDLTQHAERGLASVSETYNKATRSLREMAKEMFAKMN